MVFDAECALFGENCNLNMVDRPAGLLSLLDFPSI